MEKMSDDQLKKQLGFGLYGRYAVMRDIINKNRKEGEKFKVLDVGGRGNMMKKFLPDDRVFFLDPLVDSDDENFIKGDGCAMPLDDGSYDWVASADVFEHIPKEKKDNFLTENIRVARLGVILTAPFYSPDVAQAELNANENYKVLHKGEDHIWLKEHIENGLPDMAGFENLLKEKNIQFQKLHNNQLFLWQMLIGLEFLADKNLDESIKKEVEEFNHFYNTEVFPFDNQEPSYRKIYFIKKDPNLKNMEISGREIDNELFLKTIKKGLNISNKINNANKNLIQQKDREIALIKSSKFGKIRERYLKIMGK